jgi:hypothetical protein
MWLESIKELLNTDRTDELANKITEHVDASLLNQAHALNDVCVQFAHEFSQHYSRDKLNSPIHDEHQSQLRSHYQQDIRDMIDRARTDITTFIEKLLQVLFNKYWAYAFENVSNSAIDCEQLVYTCILKHIFSIGVYAKLLHWYGRMHGYQNDTLNEKMLEFKLVTLRHLKVKRLFRLTDQYDGDDIPYTSVIDRLSKYDVLFTIDEKLSLLTRVIDDISVVVKHYYENDPRVSDEDVILGADDMLPIFVVCVCLAD